MSGTPWSGLEMEMGCRTPVCKLECDEFVTLFAGSCLSRGSIPPGADHVSLLDEYRDRCARDVDDGYAWGTHVLAALDESVVVESAVEAWRRHRARLLDPMASIVRGLAGLGVDVAELFQGAVRSDQLVPIQNDLSPFPCDGDQRACKGPCTRGGSRPAL